MFDRKPISLFVDGLSFKEIAAIEERMRDPGFSGSLFLGSTESLVERIKADAAVLHELGITHDQIADRLETLVREARGLRDLRESTPEYQRRRYSRLLQILEREDFSNIFKEELEESAVIVDGRFSISTVGFRGFQPCPFEYRLEGGSIQTCGRASVDHEISNIRTGASISVSELLIHLIRDHQFFEGEGLSYRLDPRGIVEILEMVG